MKYPDCGGIVNIDKKNGGVALPKSPPLETDLECNKCESNLYLRSGARGLWLGCSRYPKCRGRGAWKSLEDDVRTNWEAAMENHIAENPAPTVHTVDGEICEPGFQPEKLRADFKSASPSAAGGGS